MKRGWAPERYQCILFGPQVTILGQSLAAHPAMAMPQIPCEKEAVCEQEAVESLANASHNTIEHTHKCGVYRAFYMSCAQIHSRGVYRDFRILRSTFADAFGVVVIATFKLHGHTL